MNKRIKNLLNYIKNKTHHQYRQKVTLNFAEEFKEGKYSDIQRVTELIVRILHQEKAVILPQEKIIGLRTITEIPDIYTEKEWQEIEAEHYIHEKGYVSNICPDYGSIIQEGLENKKKEILKNIKEHNDEDSLTFLKSVVKIIDAIEYFSDKYLQEARRKKREDLVSILTRIPRYGAQTFHQALQFFRIIHFALWYEGNYHNTIGRFDQYMYPYLKNDLDKGRLDYDSAFELLEEFFISFNKDSDLYPGIQQGDNGQSMVLGGVNSKGVNSFNLLSEMCLKASKELKLIDPKINLRVNKDTKMEIFKLGTELTKEGLGFPQYSNDDVVIPGLVNLGYSYEDASNYVVAACWEFIIPKYGMDIPNIEALSFVKIVDNTIHSYLELSQNFDQFMDYIDKEIEKECNRLFQKVNNIWMVPAPLMSLLMDNCIEEVTDISQGARYNNFGFHGTGLATAADSLAVIKKLIFEEKAITSTQLISILDSNFEGYENLWAKFKYDLPKMGNNNDYVDNIGKFLLDRFAKNLKGKKNKRGGILKPGTGSAMYYLWHSKEPGASPNGRRKNEEIEANYSPSLFTRIKGPFSLIKSFTKPDLKKTINGGPLTLELHDTVFQNEESTEKVAMLVKSFIELGGHQLQLNSVNRDILLAAQKNPDKYKNLIVRVWGWSAYFIELDKQYQDHIIKRTEIKF